MPRDFADELQVLTRASHLSSVEVLFLPDFLPTTLWSEGSSGRQIVNRSSVGCSDSAFSTDSSSFDHWEAVGLVVYHFACMPSRAPVGLRHRHSTPESGLPLRMNRQPARMRSSWSARYFCRREHSSSKASCTEPL